MSSTIPAITLDGPGGTGKGTVGRLLARRLGWHYLDSGAIYRVFSLYAHDQGISPDDHNSINKLGDTIQIQLDADGVPGRALCNGRDLTDEIRTERCGELASRYASVAEVREVLLDLQRRQRISPGLVADGRDMGSRVFPDATLKIFLDASLDVRVARRHKQLMEKGFDDSLARLREDIAARDARDASRAASPMIMAPDAIRIDTSDMSIDEVVEEVMCRLRSRIESVTAAGDGNRRRGN